MKNQLFLYIAFCAVAIIVTACGTSVSSQNLTQITVKPVWEFQEKISYQLEYEIEGRGENAIGKSILKNQFTIEKVGGIKDTSVIKIVTDKTTCSNDNLLEDGEGAMMYAMLGMNMTAKIDKNGSFIKIENEDEVIREFKAELTGFSDEQKDRMVNQMLQENRNLFFSKIFELNYANLFKHTNKTFQIPNTTETDSTIVATPTTPSAAMKTIEKVKYQSDFIEITTNMTILTAIFKQEFDGVTYTSQPNSNEMNEIVLLDNEGLLQSISTEMIQQSNGFEVSKDGEVINAATPFTQMIKTTMTKL